MRRWGSDEKSVGYLLTRWHPTGQCDRTLCNKHRVSQPIRHRRSNSCAGLPTHATRLTPGRSDQRLHPTPERVPHQPLPRDRLVQSLQLEKGERLVEQLSRIGGDQITGAKLIDGQPDDLGVVVAQIVHPLYGDELHRSTHAREPGSGHSRPVRHRQHPAAVIPIERVEHLQLKRLDPDDSCLLTQRSPDGISRAPPPRARTFPVVPTSRRPAPARPATGRRAPSAPRCRPRQTVVGSQ